MYNTRGKIYLQVCVMNNENEMNAEGMLPKVQDQYHLPQNRKT